MSTTAAAQAAKPTAPEAAVRPYRMSFDRYWAIVRDVLARDVALVVEMADSSLAVDTGETLEGYAKDGIPVYRVVNIPGRTVDVYTEPSGPRKAGPSCHTQRRSYRPDEDVPVVLEGREVGRVAAKDLLR